MHDKNLSIVIIDDSVEDREFIKRLLKKIYPKAEFREAENGDEGLNILTETSPNLVLLDYLLPDMSGIEFLNNLKEKAGSYVTYPIIALTGQGDEVIATEFLKNGAKDYLIKSKITEEALYRAINNALEKIHLKKLIFEKQRELYNFSHTVAHDLKAPLQRIIAYVNLFEKLGPDAIEKQKKCLQNIKNSSQYSVEFINSLINYSEVGRSQVELAPIDLNLPVNNALTNLEVAIKDTQTVVEKAELPMINGDALALTQLFQNLIGNAIKFQKNDKPFVRIDCSVHNDKFCKIAIEDKGVGIPADKREDIFLPFNRLHSKNDFPGSGIGLATCQNIVAQHNGKIWVEPAGEQGSIFYIQFPKV